MPLARTLGTERCQLKERPDCRAFIVKERLVPDIVRFDNQFVWDGRSARDRNGDRAVFTPEMPDGTRQELRRLARIGFFGDLSATVLNYFKYMRLREVFDKKRGGVFVGVSLWEPRYRGKPRRSLKRRR
jgi:hypothetical protein